MWAAQKMGPLEQARGSFNAQKCIMQHRPQTFGWLTWPGGFGPWLHPHHSFQQP